MDPTPILNQHRAEQDYFGGILLNSLRDNMPWGLEIELPNGASATLVKMNNQEAGSRGCMGELNHSARVPPTGSAAGQKQHRSSVMIAAIHPC